MITIFTIPKAFIGDAKLVQRNSIGSWLELSPKPEIILLGDEPGIKETAKELGIVCIENIKRSEFGIPLMSSAFELAQKNAKNGILVYINCDIILTQDFIDAIFLIKKENLNLFLMSGQRWDIEPVDVEDILKIKNIQDIKKFTCEKGKMHGLSGMDYFVFPKNYYSNMPDFSVGVSGWDSWLVYYSKVMKVPIIDSTLVATIIHQNHPPRNKKRPSYDKEEEINFKLAGGQANMMTLREADYILTKNGLEKAKFPRNIFSKLSLFYPWRLVFLIKRKIEKLIGRIL